MKPALLFLGAALLLPVSATAAMRPEVAKYLLQAENDLKTQNYAAALAEINRASKTGALTSDESLAIAQLRGTAAAGAGQYELAATSYETVLASGAEPPATRLLLLQAIAGFYAHAADDAQTVTWVDKYIAAGGTDQNIRALKAQADYAQGHYAACLQDVRRDAANGARLPAAELQLAASAASKSGDPQAYFESLQVLLINYPTPDEWDAAITLVQTSPGFPDGLVLDAERLRVATSTLNQPSDYEDYAERAILAGQPAEAKRVLDAGFANGLLTTETDGGHAARLQKLAASQSAKPQNAATAPATPLDEAIAKGSGFTSIPGYAAGNVNDSTAALARLWQISTTAPQS